MSFDLSEARTWSFAGGEWQAGADGGMAPVDAFDANTECGMQACRFAIATDTSYRDFRATFHVRHDTAHSDVGLIFRARNRCDFTVLHFPCCGLFISRMTRRPPGRRASAARRLTPS
jgi:hypothetical protein